MRSRTRRGQRGFTLFELIIAMALSAVLALIGAAALSAGVDFYGRAHRLMKEHESFRATERILRREWQGRGTKVRAAQGTQLSFETSQVVFLQEVRDVSFVRYRCEAQGNEGFRLVHEAFQAPMSLSGGGSNTGGEPAAPPEPRLLLREVLLEQLSQCGFGLLGAVKTRDGKLMPAWVAQWEDTAPAPLLLRLSAVGPRGELPPWLFVAPKPPG